MTCFVAFATGFLLLLSAPQASPDRRTIRHAGQAAQAAGHERPPGTGYAQPIAGPLVVLRAFAPPAVRYGAGHLGVDLRVGADGRVLAAGDATVRFAGQVAGRGVVVLLHPDGISTEYEPLRPLVRAGMAVARGQAIGQLTGRHRGCAGRCLHWGARRGGTYLDPLALLRPLAPVRLLPWPHDG